MSEDIRRDPDAERTGRTEPPEELRHEPHAAQPHDAPPAASDQARHDGGAADAGSAREVSTETTSSSGVASTTTTEPEQARDRETHRDPSSQRVAEVATGPGASTDWNAHTGLLADDDLAAYQKRWDDIQVGFIDEPRQSVRQADDLVGEVTHQIAQRFTDSRQSLEQRWDGGDEPTTEELRQAVQRYRDFFQRLVAR